MKIQNIKRIQFHGSQKVLVNFCKIFLSLWKKETTLFLHRNKNGKKYTECVDAKLMKRITIKNYLSAGSNKFNFSENQMNLSWIKQIGI